MFPCTKITNKHLLPVYDRPMIFYPLAAMVRAGITEIMIVTGKEHAGDFIELLGNGREFMEDLAKLEPALAARDVKLTYRVQSGPGGISDALSLAEDFVGNDNCLVILGDNIFLDNLSGHVDDFSRVKRGAFIFLKALPNEDLFGDIKGVMRARFGVAEVSGGRVTRILEKPLPKDCVSDLVVTGIYMYTPDVFEKIRKLKPSWRGELEITDVNQMYVDEGTLNFDVLSGIWSDAGTFDSLRRVSNLM